jgi:hypothetical protein
MATAYANPLPSPELLEADGRFDYEAYKKRCEQYRADTLDYIKRELKGKGKYLGKVIRFPVADGYAQYMIWTLTKWIHLDEVDGWHADPATIRGMRAVDVAERLDRRSVFGSC